MSIISIENLSKSYLVGHQGPRERYLSLRDSLVRHAKSLGRKTLDMACGRQIVQGDEVEEFWALRDVSFDVQAGEVLGIVGRNGAGKSTLLKILSRITEPTKGRVTLRGRVSSLLEVGTGFHPELTGRENIFLNGAILGMSRRELKSKFDQIVDFSGVEKFLDTPVKRYSSGMYVRLAFAVAAHLEPEILVVDEVLAVGDAEFQAKCLGKMQDVANSGRTVLFVSHNMAAVAALCQKALLLSKGSVLAHGATSEILNLYMAKSASGETLWRGDLGTDDAKVTYCEVLPNDTGMVVTNRAIEVVIELELLRPITGLILAWEVWNIKENLLAYSAHDDASPPPATQVSAGRYRATMTIPADTLASGRYSLSLDLGIHNVQRIVPQKRINLEFYVENFEGIARRFPSDWVDIFRPAWSWRIETH